MADAPEKLRIRDLTPAQLWGIVTAIAAAFAGGFFLGNNLASGEAPSSAEIAASFYAMQRTEYIQEADSERYAYVETEPGGGTLVLLLNSEPIPESVRVRFGPWIAQPWEFELLRSAVLLATNATEQSYRTMFQEAGAFIEYAPKRPRPQSDRLVRRDGRLYLGSTQIHDGERTLWPSGGIGPLERYPQSLLGGEEAQ